MNREKGIVYILLVIKSFIYGLSVLWLGKILETIAVFDVLALRFLISSLVIITLAQLKIIKVSFKGKPIRLLLLVAVFEPVGYFLFETLGVQQTSTLMAGIILSLMPLFALVTESVVLKERTSYRQKLFLASGLIGAVVIVIMNEGASTGSEIKGIVFLLAALISGSLFLAFSRKASSTFSSIEITMYMSIVSAIVFNAINIVRHMINQDMHLYFAPLGDMGILSGLLFLAIICSIAATGINNYALSKIPVSSVSALGGMTMVVTVLAGVIVNGETFTLYHLLGTILILAGGIGVNYYRTE